MPRAYSAEYLETLRSDRWRELRAVCFALTWGCDCIFPLLPAQDLDHLDYRHLGTEQPVRDVVPLSRFMHRRVVTPLRARYGRRWVNPPLRAMFALWIAADVAGTAWLLDFGIRFVVAFATSPPPGSF